jgi:acetylglutamate kinase
MTTTAITNAANTMAAEAENLLSALCDLLDRETTAVRASDFEGFKNLQADKFAMLTRYKSLMDTIKTQSHVFKNVSDTLKKQLQDAAARFEKSTTHNIKALDAGSKSMQRITDRIIRCARDTVHATRQTYNNHGNSSINSKTPVSLKLDEVL